MQPKARSQELLIEEVFNELVIYDCRTQQAHRLNPTAAFVWRTCDGNHSVADLVELFTEEFGGTVSEKMVRWAMDSLTQAGLLEDESPKDGRVRDTSRRAALQKMSLTGAISIFAPIVATLAAPTPAQAGSGIGGRRGGGANHHHRTKHWVSHRKRDHHDGALPDHHDTGGGSNDKDKRKGKKEKKHEAKADEDGNRNCDRH